MAFKPKSLHDFALFNGTVVYFILDCAVCRGLGFSYTVEIICRSVRLGQLQWVPYN